MLIENQLERTDPIHLGQLLTYGAGLEAVTMVWIAKRFTDWHRAALDWLNEITAAEFSFFGLEIELWRIGDSPMAPKFNVVSHPSNWTKTVSRISRNELTSSTNQLYLEYWKAFRDLLKERNGVINPVKLSALNYQYFKVGRTHFSLLATINKNDKWIRVNLTLTGLDAKEHFYHLQRDKADIEKAIGAELDWEEKCGKKRSYIGLSVRN